MKTQVYRSFDVCFVGFLQGFLRFSYGFEGFSRIFLRFLGDFLGFSCFFCFSHFKRSSTAPWETCFLVYVFLVVCQWLF